MSETEAVAAEVETMLALVRERYGERLDAEQLQAGPPFRLPIELELQLDGEPRPRLERIELKEARETVTLEQYKRNTRKSGFRDARIESMDCDADACTVKLWVTYDHPAMKGIQTPITETWVFDKGQAWYVYRG